jgi:hypothetical protein
MPVAKIGQCRQIRNPQFAVGKDHCGEKNSCEIMRPPNEYLNPLDARGRCIKIHLNRFKRKMKHALSPGPEF